MNKPLGMPVTIKKDYQVVTETLERMGVRNNQEKKFFPSCYCVEHNGEHKIYHFKELFLMEGKESSYNDLDELRRNTIIKLLADWGIVEPKQEITEIIAQKIDVINFKNKKEYKICHKYFFKTKV
jgi:hypothetical protein